MNRTHWTTKMYSEIIDLEKLFKIKSLKKKRKITVSVGYINKHNTSSLVMTSRIYWNSQVYLMKDLENEPQLRLKYYQRQKYSKKL